MTLHVGATVFALKIWNTLHIQTVWGSQSFEIAYLRRSKSSRTYVTNANQRVKRKKGY